MHPSLILLADAASSSGSDLKIALIGAGALVLASTVPAVLSRRERTPREIAQLRLDQQAERRRLEASEHEANNDRDDMERDRDQAVDALHRLERFVWLLGYDPETQQRLTREERASGQPNPGGADPGPAPGPGP